MDRSFLKKVVFSFVRAFFAAFGVGATGLLLAQDYTAGKAAAIALLVGAVAAGLRAAQTLIEPQAKTPLALVALSFTRAFLAVFGVGVVGLLYVPDLSAFKAAGSALIVASVAAGIRAVQRGLTGE